MLPAALVCAGILAVSLPSEGTEGLDLAAYEKARAGIGRDAEAHIKLALWCEAHGLQAERTKHLALAVLINPRNATARGLMGLVAYRGHWQQPNVVAEEVKADADLAAALAEYNGRRARTPETADAQWKLALWCEEQGLKGEAQAHLATVVRLDPSREAAWKRLGCKKVGGRWVTEAQLAAEKAESDAQKQANASWKPLLTKWRGWLADRDRDRREEAKQRLSTVIDPRAVPAVWAVFALGDARQQAVAVQVLGQIDAPASSRALAMLAVFSPSAEVRRAATETLKGRDAREYAGMLIALLRDPIKYEVRPVGGPGSPGALFVAGQRFNVQRLYAPPPAPTYWIGSADQLTTDWYGLPEIVHNQMLVGDQVTWGLTEAQAFQHLRTDSSQLLSFAAPYLTVTGRDNINTAVQQNNAALEQRIRQQIAAWPAGTKNPTVNEHRAVITRKQTTIPIGQMMVEAEKSALVAQQQLRNDMALLDRYNQGVSASNDKVTGILNNAIGENLAAEPKVWKDWWIDQLGYRSDVNPSDQPVPTIVENVPLNYLPQPVPINSTTSTTLGGITDFRRISCFGAGTLVRTLRGPEPIEGLRVGDQVLTQDLRTGALGYEPILVVHHNPPSPTFLIHVAGETIVSSPFHRFWKAGKGWVMARDLKTGDTLRMLDGLAGVDSVESGPVQKVYNLDVAADHDFFAGARGALVHDNSLPDLRQAPFDAEPSLSAMVQPAK